MDEPISPDIPLQKMVGSIEPGWAVVDAEPAGGGYSSVYELTVDTGTDRRTVFLKSPATDEDSGIPADARISALLDRETDIPVPKMLGLVESHPELPSPFYVSGAMPGEQLPYEEVGWLPDDTLAGIACDLGEFLGALHSIDAVDRFGHVTASDAATYEGEPPAGRVDDLTVANGEESWPEYLRGRVDFQLDRLSGTRFETLEPDLAAWIHDRIDDLEGPFDPVLGRNDHGFHNLLVDADEASVTAMLDWAYTLAVPPVFDVEFAVYLFSGTFMTGIRAVKDRRVLVREAFLDGYRRSAPELASAVETPFPLYEMLARLRILNDFELLAPQLPAERVDLVAEDLRTTVESTIST